MDGQKEGGGADHDVTTYLQIHKTDTARQRWKKLRSKDKTKRSARKQKQNTTGFQQGFHNGTYVVVEQQPK